MLGYNSFQLQCIKVSFFKHLKSKIKEKKVLLFYALFIPIFLGLAYYFANFAVLRLAERGYSCIGFHLCKYIDRGWGGGFN